MLNYWQIEEKFSLEVKTRVTMIITFRQILETVAWPKFLET